MVLCRELDLSNNTISELGEGLPRMTSLQVLRLENNRIDALPDNIGSCKALVKLDLSTNNLHSLPDSMGQFRKLQRLNVANNMLRRVPASMGGLKTLKELDLRCSLKALPSELCCCGKPLWCVLLWLVHAFTRLGQFRACHVCALEVRSARHYISIMQHCLMRRVT